MKYIIKYYNIIKCSFKIS